MDYANRCNIAGAASFNVRGRVIPYIYIYIQWRSQDFSEREAIVTTQL